MGRQKEINPDDPKRFFTRKGKRKTTHYYTGTRPQINLGSDRVTALKRWAELESSRDLTPTTFRGIANLYVKDILPKKAPRTQQDNLNELKHLIAVFGHVQIESIKPVHVHRYLHKREAPIRANREKALLSHIINYARNMGYTEMHNPCIGVKGNPERGRDRYVTDSEYGAVWGMANPILQDIMDLLLHTGQRPADVLKILLTDIYDGALWVEQNKTGKKLGIAIEGELAGIVDRCLARKKQVGSFYLISTDKGQSVSATTLRSWFRSARQRAHVSFQLRDLRAKNATDTGNLEIAKARLGHSTIRMTEHYVRNRKGSIVKPLK